MSTLKGKKRRLEENSSSTKSHNLRSKKECPSEVSHASITIFSKNEIIEDKTTLITEQENEMLSLNSASLNVMHCITNCNEINEQVVNTSFKSSITRSKSNNEEVSVINNEESIISEVASTAIDTYCDINSRTINQVNVVDKPEIVLNIVPVDNTYSNTDNFSATEKLRNTPVFNTDNSCNLQNNKNCEAQAIQDNLQPSIQSSSEFPEGLSFVPTIEFESVVQKDVHGAIDQIKSEDMTDATGIFPKTSNNNFSITSPHVKLSELMENERVQHSSEIHKQLSQSNDYCETLNITHEINSDNRHNADNTCKKQAEDKFSSNIPCQKNNSNLLENISLNRNVSHSLEPLFQGETRKKNNVHVESNMDKNVMSLPNINDQIIEQQDISDPNTIVNSDYIKGNLLHKVNTANNFSQLPTDTAADETDRQGMVFSDKQLFNGIGSVENAIVKTDSKVMKVVELVNENIGANDTADDTCKINKHTNEDVICTKQICSTTGHSQPDVVQKLDEGIQCSILNSCEFSKSTSTTACHPTSSRNIQLLELCDDQDIHFSKSHSHKQTITNNLVIKHCDRNTCTMDNQDNLNKVQFSLSINKSYHNPNSTFEAEKDCLKYGNCTSAIEKKQTCPLETSSSKEDVSSEWSDLDMCQVSTQNFIDNNEIEKAEKEAIEIIEFEKSFSSSQRQCREIVDKKRQEGSHFVNNILAQLTDLNQQLMMLKNQIEIVKREMTNNKPNQHVSKFFSKTNSNFSFFK